ncbi:hypothetical protein JCM3774_003607 [Rhodotorula dairenensis]
MSSIDVSIGSPTPSAAALACLDDQIVDRIALFFRQIHVPDQLEDKIEGIEAPYTALSTLALVARPFRRAAQREMNRVLLFRSGGVVSLDLASPLAGNLSKPMRFQLQRLGIIDDCPSMRRDWSATFRILTSVPALTGLLDLDLKFLPRAPAHMLALLPAAPSCVQLALPFIDPSDPHQWRLWIFARLCESLRVLSVRGFGGDAINVLLAFPTGPPAVHIDELAGTVGYGHPLVDESVIPVKDAVNTLVSVLIQKAQADQPVQQLVVDTRRNISAKHHANILELVASAGVRHLRLGIQQDRLTEEEVSILADYIAKTQTTDRYKWTRSLIELEEIE